jgi:hypothetical protein
MLGPCHFRSAPATSPDTGDPVDAIRRCAAEARCSASVQMQTRARLTAFYPRDTGGARAAWRWKGVETVRAAPPW